MQASDELQVLCKQRKREEVRSARSGIHPSHTLSDANTNLLRLKSECDIRTIRTYFTKAKIEQYH